MFSNALSLILIFQSLINNHLVRADYDDNALDNIGTINTNSSDPNEFVSQVLDDDIMNNITKNYNNLVRPAKLVNISLKISLRQIVSVDVQNQIITTNLYLSMVWLDKRLLWSPGNFETNLNLILIPANKLWLPDLSVMNSASGTGFISISSSNLAAVRNDGVVYLILNIIGLQTRCKMNVMKYPFDVQVCQIIVGSWQYDSSRVNFESNDKLIDITNYQINPVWNLEKVKVSSITSTNRYIKALNSSNDDIYISLTIKRGPLYIMINNVYPVLILNAVTLLSYFLPFVPQVTLSMTTFLTYGVYSVRTSGDLPVQSEYFPLISVYFFLAVIYTFISLGWFLFANQLMSKNKIPKALKPFVNFILSLKSNKVTTTKNHRTSIKNVKIEDIEEQTSQKKSDESQLSKKKCIKCETCYECVNSKEKEDQKKKSKEMFEAEMNVLNIFIFCIMFLIIFISNVSLWLQIST